MLKLFPPDSDVTILDAVYRRPRKDETTGKWSDCNMTILYKDNITGLKHHEVINKPPYEFYVANDDVYVPHHLFFIEKEKVHPVSCECNKIEKTIAELTGQTDLYYDNLNNGNKSANQLMHYHPRVFMSDMHPEDYYRFKFDRMYKNNVFNVKKAFFDIEVDGIDMLGDFPTADDSPINAVCLINLANNQVYSYLLRNPKNKSMVEFEQNLGPATFDKLKDTIMSKVGGYKKYHRYGLDKLEYNVFFYDEEVHLIQDLFIGINTLEPDFLLAWNMSFDVPFIINRLRHLGFNPADIMCHPDYEFKEAMYYIDERNFDEFAERGDFARISSNTIYLDQMIQFASRRKGQSAFKSMKLDDIGKAVAGIGKVDYHHICNSIVDLPYADYETFWIYNVLDVIVQVCVENKTNDVDYIFAKCLANNTRYSKGHRQTVYLANRATKSFFDMGYVIGNNVNKMNPPPTQKFKGAYVANPALVDNYSKLKLNGDSIDVYDNLDDFDYARLYPSVIQEFNMAANTQIGKIFMDKEIHDKENPFGDIRYDRGGAFIEDLQSHVYLEFGSRWLHLADYSTLIDDIKEFYTTQMTPSGPLEISSDGLIKPLIQINGLQTPLTRMDNLTKPLIRFIPSDFTKINEELDRKGIR